MNSKKLTQTVALLISASTLLISFPGISKACSSKTTTISQAKNQANQTGTIVEIAASNPNFKTLVAAVQAAGLVETLSGNTPFTVFAPTDKAFAKLPKATLEKLLKPENKATLQKILTYHVVSGTVESKSLKSGSMETVEGNQVEVGVSTTGRIRVNKSRVIQADIKASNGVIHVIDTVLLPPGV